MVKLEVFSAIRRGPGCVAIIELAKRVKAKYGDDELQLVIYTGQEGMPKFEEYGLFLRAGGGGQWQYPHRGHVPQRGHAQQCAAGGRAMSQV